MSKGGKIEIDQVGTDITCRGCGGSAQSQVICDACLMPENECGCSEGDDDE